jgi:hypothetical protein
VPSIIIIGTVPSILLFWDFLFHNIYLRKTTFFRGAIMAVLTAGTAVKDDVPLKIDYPTDNAAVQHDLNLMLVYAVEGYARRHSIPEIEAFNVFRQYGINEYFRKYYGVLHTQDFDEDVFFAEDLIDRAREESLAGAGK